MAGITLDTGALISIERRRARIGAVIRFAHDTDAVVTVPAAVVAEWWRGRTDVRERILASVDVEPLDDALARLAGEALAATPGATPIDAIVMASAARRGDVVYTSDVEDLARLQAFFRGTRVFAA